MTFDEIRKAHPALGFALYALEPSAGVTLEVLAPDGEMFTFKGASETDVLVQAFPPAPVVEKEIPNAFE